MRWIAFHRARIQGIIYARAEKNVYSTMNVVFDEGLSLLAWLNYWLQSAIYQVVGPDNQWELLQALSSNF